jgi:preprotein translocase subunit SecB
MTTPIQQPPLDIQRYHVEELIFRALREYDPNLKTSSVIDVEFDVHQDEVVTRDYRINMQIQLAAKGYTVEENAPYTVDLTIVGYFTLAEGISDEQTQRMIFLNAPSILFGIARGIAGQATGASRHGQFVLPTVNFVGIEKARIQRELDAAKSELTSLQATLSDSNSEEDTP